MKIKPPFCPLLTGDNDLTQCQLPVTRHAFETVCNISNFEVCRYYAEIMGKLKTPIAWLQYKAVKTGGVSTR